MDVIIDSLAWLPIMEIDPTDLFLLKRRLTLVPHRTSEYDDLSPIELFVERGGLVGIPREYYFHEWRRGAKEIHAESEGCQLGSSSAPIKLRPHQVPVVEKILEYYKNGNMGCCIQAETAFGKTVCALEIANRLGKSTIIIVHKESLADQWEQKIQEFLPGMRVGRIQGATVDYRDKDFVLGLIQSLYEKELPDDVFDSFGLLISDENHRTSARKWAKAIPRFKAKYKLGLSATQRRKDQLEEIFVWHIGPVIVDVEGFVMRPDIYIRDTRFSIVATPWFDPARMPRVRLITALTEAGSRNNQIVEEVWKSLKSGRKPIVMSHRIKHLQDMMALLRYRMKLEGKEFSIGEFYRGQRKISKEDLQEAKTRDILFGTYKMIEEGEDIVDADCLFLTTPLSDPVQACGRLLRKKEGKRTPIVVDFVDRRIRQCESLYYSRLRWYREKGWEIHGDR